MRQAISNPLVKVKAHAYESFFGLNTERHHSALDAGENQYLSELTNGFSDNQGQIVREPSSRHLEGDSYVSNVWMIDSDTYIYAEQLEGSVRLVSSNGHSRSEAFAAGSALSAAVFSRELYTASYGQKTLYYDGSLWKEVSSPSLAMNPPAFLASINRRLICAGMPSYPYRVWLSRVDTNNVFPQDENENDTNVLRAGDIDISNMSNSGDPITGIAGFEWNRLAIFTNNQTLVYMIDPDVSKWSIQDQTAIDVGCASHNSIVNSGSELIFCSANGIHALKRSQYNNISVYSIDLSDDVTLLYRELYRLVKNKQRITASWDSDNRRYHIYFPFSKVESHRLSVAIPRDEKERPRWSYGRHLNATCSADMAGRFILGTPGGVFDRYKLGQDAIGATPVEIRMLTPLLWCGSMIRKKTAYSYIVHVSGTGQIEVTFLDESGVVLQMDVIDIDDSSTTGSLPGVPIMQQYERKLDRTFTGAQIRIRAVGSDLLRINGLVIITREQ